MEIKQITQEEWNNIVEQLKGKDDVIAKQAENIDILKDQLKKADIHIEALVFFIRKLRNDNLKKCHWLQQEFNEIHF